MDNDDINNDNNEFIDWFIVLDINEIATDKDIEKAFRKKALLYHPDRFNKNNKNNGNNNNNNNKEEEDDDDLEYYKKMFLLINKAKDVLLNPDKKDKFLKRRKIIELNKSRFEELDILKKEMKIKLEKKENEINLSKSFSNFQPPSSILRDNKIAVLQKQTEQYIYDYMKMKQRNNSSSKDNDDESDDESDTSNENDTNQKYNNISIEMLSNIENSFLKFTSKLKE